MTREEAARIIEERVRVTEYVESSYVDCVDIEALRIAIKALAQPVRKKGKWEKYVSPTEDDDGQDAWDCAECGAMVEKPTSFCPRCGADMRGGEDATAI